MGVLQLVFPARVIDGTEMHTTKTIISRRKVLANSLCNVSLGGLFRLVYKSVPQKLRQIKQRILYYIVILSAMLKKTTETTALQ